MNRGKKILRLILGDQLNIQYSWFRERSDQVHYVMMEIRQETDYVTHHIWKIVGFFLAMRNFADSLREAGHQLIYLKINDPANHQDLENRKSLPEDHPLPEPLLFNRDVSPLLEETEQAGITSIGNIDPLKFTWPLTRDEQLKLRDHFLNSMLVHFGNFQDAMTQKSWILFHSRLSLGLNLKLIHPMEIIGAVETHWNLHSRKIHIAQAEGFIRQILGWREYMREIYWAEVKTGEHACPFNSLYWHFYARNREKLLTNPKVRMMYRTWDSMD